MTRQKGKNTTNLVMRHIRPEPGAWSCRTAPMECTINFGPSGNGCMVAISKCSTRWRILELSSFEPQVWFLLLREMKMSLGFVGQRIRFCPSPTGRCRMLDRLRRLHRRTMPRKEHRVPPTFGMSLVLARCRPCQVSKCPSGTLDFRIQGARQYILVCNVQWQTSETQSAFL